MTAGEYTDVFSNGEVLISTPMQVIDPRALARLRKLGGDELVHKMIDLFLPHTKSRVEAAHAALDSGLLSEVERAAHAIRSSCGNLGADELGELAVTIEQLASEQRGADLTPLVHDLDEAFARVKSRLEKERRAGSS